MKLGHRILLLVFVLGIGAMNASAQDSSFLVLGGHMYGTSPDKKPAPGFQAVADSLVRFHPDAYLAGGDCTATGDPAEWDSVETVYSGKWDFPFIPVPGNHDSVNMIEWHDRWGPDTWTQDFGSTRVIFMWTSQTPNGNPDQTRHDFVVNALAQAATDSAITDVLPFQHHLAVLKVNGKRSSQKLTLARRLRYSREAR